MALTTLINEIKCTIELLLFTQIKIGLVRISMQINLSISFSLKKIGAFR